MAEARSVATLEEVTRGTRVSLYVDDDGLHLTFGVNVPPPREALRRAWRSLRRAWRAIEYTFFPIAMPVLLATTLAVVAWVTLSPPTAWVRSGGLAHVVWAISTWFPWLPGTPLPVRVGVLAAWAALGGMWLIAQAERALLRTLLADKTFLYAARSPTPWVRAWFAAVRWLTRKRGGQPHMTYAFQRSLPRLPVPELARTVDGYLASARLLQPPDEFARTEAAARAFLASEGPRLQWYLQLKSWLAPNYVTDWWEKYVYLRGRSPIAIGSNYYCLDSGRSVPTPVQEARGGVLIHAICRYTARLEDEAIEPVMLADGAVPLDMEQARRMFGTVRTPGRECDEIRHHLGADPAGCRHVAVFVRGHWYKLPVYRRDGTLRGPDDLEDALAAIKRDAAAQAAPTDAEAALPALTAENRTRWAELREAHFSEGVNRRSLAAIETALFVVTLADDAYDVMDWSARGKRLLAGNREHPDVWYDKSLTLVVQSNGAAGLNAEHSWADAPAVAHMWETVLLLYEHRLAPYDGDGHVRRLGGGAADADAWDELADSLVTGERSCRRSRAARVEARANEALTAAAAVLGAPALAPPASASAPPSTSSSTTPAAAGTPSPSSSAGGEPLGSPGALGSTSKAPTGRAGAGGGVSPPWSRLGWSLNRATEAAIASAVESHRRAWDDLDLAVGAFTGYGKDFVKRCRVSPDAYIQAAFQLAYWRDQGHFDATYESSMTRLFLHGRTETVRPLTQEAAAFVRAMEDAASPPAEKLRALQAAAARHVLGYTDAMAGRGIDRHLFALLIVAVGKGVDSPFLKAALSVPWKLSTSQQPQQQTAYWSIKEPGMREKVSPGGGFGPVAADGYGVSYMVSGEGEVFFHVSSQASAGNTDSRRFLGRIFTALTEMKAVLEVAVAAEEEQGRAKKAAKGAAAAPAPAPAAEAVKASAPAPPAGSTDGGSSGGTGEPAAK